MKRLEIIANQSVKNELMESLEAALPKIEYTLLPTVQGKGRSKKKQGTRVWPETNFLLISYISDLDLETARKVLASVKTQYAAEGIFACASEAEPLI